MNQLEEYFAELEKKLLAGTEIEMKTNVPLPPGLYNLLANDTRERDRKGSKFVCQRGRKRRWLPVVAVRGASERKGWVGIKI